VIPSHDPSRISRLRPVWRKLPSLRGKSPRVRGFADFYQRFFGETPLEGGSVLIAAGRVAKPRSTTPEAIPQLADFTGSDCRACLSLDPSSHDPGRIPKLGFPSASMWLPRAHEACRHGYAAEDRRARPNLGKSHVACIAFWRPSRKRSIAHSTYRSAPSSTSCRKACRT
jgi:hypothetical protein